MRSIERFFRRRPLTGGLISAAIFFLVFQPLLSSFGTWFLEMASKGSGGALTLALDLLASRAASCGSHDGMRIFTGVMGVSGIMAILGLVALALLETKLARVATEPRPEIKKSVFRHLRFLHWLVPGGLALICSCLMFMISLSYKMITSFERDLTVCRAIATEQEVAVFRARWVLMKTWHEWEGLSKDIGELKAVATEKIKVKQNLP